jgi:hypothetical protein
VGLCGVGQWDGQVGVNMQDGEDGRDPVVDNGRIAVAFLHNSMQFRRG